MAQCAAGALATIREITRQREDQWERARELPVDALAGGVELRDALTEALRASYEADVGFQSWARRHLDLGCQGDPDADPDYQWALDRSGAAEAAKDRFAALWQPIADAYGLPRRTASSI
ncbi:hypothetical protein [Thermocatellispora tengchongensis]|uniref:hypothetical protein n=1 Tax=Thermocatellispora tengchongensis TaxID=1073253 RepID=UPI003626E751